MAFIADTGSVAAKPSIMATLKAVFVGYFNAYLLARSRSEVIAHYEAMSDSQLSAIGITRARIVAHVFRDRFYL